jgi:hypothetical protein
MQITARVFRADPILTPLLKAQSVPVVRNFDYGTLIGSAVLRRAENGDIFADMTLNGEHVPEEGTPAIGYRITEQEHAAGGEVTRALIEIVTISISDGPNVDPEITAIRLRDAGIPRSACPGLNVPAELSIRASIRAVEEMPADTRLTDAVVLLGRALDRVAAFVDGKD